MLDETAFHACLATQTMNSAGPGREPISTHPAAPRCLQPEGLGLEQERLQEERGLLTAGRGALQGLARLMAESK